MGFHPAIAIEASDWLNTTDPISLEKLRGKVVLLEAFQMLCPGCVSHSLPQAMRVRQLFSDEDVAVIGLHSVFEHHEAQGSKAALAAFLHEYRIGFPVAIDKQSKDAGLPVTMQAYGMRGTPTTILIDRQGTVRKHKFGQENDLVLGAEIMALVKDKAFQTDDGTEPVADSDHCADGACPAPSK